MRDLGINHARLCVTDILSVPQNYIFPGHGYELSVIKISYTTRLRASLRTRYSFFDCLSVR